MSIDDFIEQELDINYPFVVFVMESDDGVDLSLVCLN